MLSGATMSSDKPGLLDRLRALLQDRALLLKAVSFGCIGVVNTLIDFALFTVAHVYLGVWIVVANIFSWTVAVTGSYVMNSLITFAAETQRQLRFKAYVSFAASQVAGLAADTATVLAVVHLMPDAVSTSLGVNPAIVGKALAIAVSFVVNFSLSHFIVFRPPGINPAELR
jgi:putative flippase GtrA